MRTLFHDGRILTGKDLLTPAPCFVSSLLVEDGVIVEAGSVPDEQVDFQIDLGGAFVMPGFNDAHLHLGEGARLRREVDLSGTRSLAEALARIAEAAKRALPGAWITGGGWDETLWNEARLPSRDDLDRVTGEHPAVFARTDVHVSVANSRALAVGGVMRGTPAPSGSAIDRDGSGEPTGILRERAARDLVERHVPSASLEQRMRDLGRVLAEAVACGITSVGDYSVDEDFAALCALYEMGELPLRVGEWLPFDLSVEELQERRAAAPQTRELRTTMLKAFLDGSLGSRTAALQAPYADAPETSGLLLYTPAQLTEMALKRAAAGFQLGFHAIGDQALAMALDTFAAVQQAYPGSRSRVEHAQVASAASFAAAREAGAIASMQPGHLLTDARWAGARLGHERSAYAYAWHSFAAAGVPLAFGTDFPVEPLSPFRGLYAAMTHSGENGEPFYPEERVSLPEALHACTQGAAWAEGAESWKGQLRPGFVADFCVLDRDLLHCADRPQDVLSTRVLRTVVGGRSDFESASGGG